MATTRDDDLPGSDTLPGSRETDIAAGTEISEEEQREILKMINGIVEQNRLSLSSGPAAGSTPRRGTGPGHFRAKKHGGLFPILVNVFAALILAGGFLLLSSFQNEAAVQAREGTRIFSDIERTLIDEIRRETNASLAAKDREINMLLASLNDIEAQLKALTLGGEALTPEQIAARDRLISEQEERRAELALAREDRSRILSEARSRETTLRLVAADPGGPDMNAARAELAELSREQSQMAAVEAQVTGLFANVHRHVAESNFHEAEHTVGLLREFLDAPAFQGFRGMQSRRDLYLQTADTLESLLEEHRIAYEAMRDGLPPPDMAAEARHREEVERLEGLIREMEVRQDPGLTALQAEHATEVGRLQEENARLQDQLNQLRQAAEQLMQLQQALPQ